MEKIELAIGLIDKLKGDLHNEMVIEVSSCRDYDTNDSFLESYYADRVILDRSMQIIRDYFA